MLVSIILNGVLFGILLSFLIGPVFFVLIETSLRKGAKHALFIDIGVLLSDIFYLLLAYSFSAQIINLLNEHTFVKYIAGCVFIIMGGFSILKKKVPTKEKKIDLEDILLEEHACDPDCEEPDCKEERFRKRTALGLIFKGVGLNVINPGVLIYWIAACTAATEELHTPPHLLPYYFIATLGTMFSVDMLKIYFAGKLKKRMTEPILQNISRVVGIIFVVFGILIFFKDFNG